MSSIGGIVLLVLVTLLSVLLAYLMYKVRAKYIYIDVHSDNSHRYEVEEYGCVSLLATVLGIISCTIAVASFVVFIFRVVIDIIIPSFYGIIAVAAVMNGIMLVLVLGVLVIMSVLSFFKELLNPPR